MNIPDPSLEVEGFLTPTDRAYLEAMDELGLRDVMLSFVESPDDLEALRGIKPDARVVAKVESRKGLEVLDPLVSGGARLMAARGDLFVELRRRLSGTD